MVRAWLLSGITMLGGLAGIGLPLLPANAQSTTAINLADGNSVLSIDLGEFSLNESWLVDGIDYLFSEIIFLNIGNDPNQPEVPLSEFQLLSSTSTDNTFTASYSGFGGQLGLQFDSTLIGGATGSNTSTREDVITIFNPTTESIDFTLITYVDFDLVLDASFENDITQFADNVLTQSDPTGVIASVAVNQDPTAVQIGPYPDLLTELYDSTRTDLPNVTSFQNGDATVALQFDRSLDPGESISFTFLKKIERQMTAYAVPEPGLILALSAVAATLCRLKRRDLL